VRSDGLSQGGRGKRDHLQKVGKEKRRHDKRKNERRWQAPTKPGGKKHPESKDQTNSKAVKTERRKGEICLTLVHEGKGLVKRGWPTKR